MEMRLDLLEKIRVKRKDKTRSVPDVSKNKMRMLLTRDSLDYDTDLRNM